MLGAAHRLAVGFLARGFLAALLFDAALLLALHLLTVVLADAALLLPMRFFPVRFVDAGLLGAAGLRLLLPLLRREGLRAGDGRDAGERCADERCRGGGGDETVIHEDLAGGGMRTLHWYPVGALASPRSHEDRVRRLQAPRGAATPPRSRSALASVAIPDHAVATHSTTGAARVTRSCACAPATSEPPSTPNTIATIAVPSV